MIQHHLLLLLIITTTNPTKNYNNYNCNYIFHLMLFPITLDDHAPPAFLLLLLFFIFVLLLLIQEQKNPNCNKSLLSYTNPNNPKPKIRLKIKNTTPSKKKFLNTIIYNFIYIMKIIFFVKNNLGDDDDQYVANFD